MRVDEVMKPAKCCRQGDAVRTCASLMKQENLGFVPICDQAGKPIGALTDRDLVIRVLAEGKAADITLLDWEDVAEPDAAEDPARQRPAGPDAG